MTLRIAIFGANGPTGRLLTSQSLAAGHHVTAVTRQPAGFALDHAGPDNIDPDRTDGADLDRTGRTGRTDLGRTALDHADRAAFDRGDPGRADRHGRLRVVGADVHDAAAVADAVAGQDAVLSTLGVPAGKAPITTYSQGAANIVAGMGRHGVRRLVVVSSSGVAPHIYSDGGLLFNRLLLPYVTRVLGRTLYDDMRRMEALIRASDLDWTIVRPSGLYHRPSPTAYTLVDGHADGRFTARADLAASMLDLLADDRHLHTVVGVITTAGNPTLLRWIRREALAKR